MPELDPKEFAVKQKEKLLIQLKNLAETHTRYSSSETFQKVSLDEYAKCLTELLAWENALQDPKNQYMSEPDLTEEMQEKFRKEIEAEAKKRRDSFEFQEILKGKDDQLLNMACEKGVDGEWQIRDVPEIKQNYAAAEREVAERAQLMRERAQLMRERAQGITAELKQTTSRSFSGTLKSWFVGNSAEYDKAYKALEGVSAGTVSKEEAIQSVRDYLDLRKSKVRNQQYGRDRFDLMMMGLKNMMEPKDFEAYCLDIDKTRNKLDPSYKVPTLHPDDFEPRMTVEQHLRNMRSKAYDKNYIPTERDAARMLAITQLSHGELDKELWPFDTGRFDRELSAKDIRKSTDALLNNPGFKGWFENINQNPENIRKLMSSTMRLCDRELEEVAKKSDQIERERDHMNQIKEARERMKNREEHNLSI